MTVPRQRRNWLFLCATSFTSVVEYLIGVTELVPTNWSPTTKSLDLSPSRILQAEPPQKPSRSSLGLKQAHRQLPMGGFFETRAI